MEAVAPEQDPMFSEAKAIYLATRKRHDQLFNTYFMRPLAGLGVAILSRTSITPNQVTLLALVIFVGATAAFVALPGWLGGLLAALICEASYFFDCVDGMLARHKKLASQQGHLFDFFTDEIKAVLLISGLGLYLYRSGGWSIDLQQRAAGDPLFLIATVVGVAVIASATSLTNFVRRPEMTGRETPIEAHYETVAQQAPKSPVIWAASQVKTFLRFLNHYPSHLWLFAALGRLDLFFWVYIAINLLYLAQGWLGLVLRFGRG